MAQKASKDKKGKEIEAFCKCKGLCNDIGTCIAQKLIQCTVCNAKMIKPACLKGRKKRKLLTVSCLLMQTVAIVRVTTRK